MRVCARSRTVARATLVVGVCIAAVGGIVAPTEGDGPQPSGRAVDVPDDGRITVVAREFRFTPDAVHVEPGQHVTVVFKNEGMLSHNLTVPALGVRAPTEQRGGTETLEFTAPKAGLYRFWCTVPGHKQAGMIGQITVAP